MSFYCTTLVSLVGAVELVCGSIGDRGFGVKWIYPREEFRPGGIVVFWRLKL
jgi:hypothetical protein